MSNRKKIKVPRYYPLKPEFPRIRIRERTDEEIDAIIREKEKEQRVPLYRTLDEQDVLEAGGALEYRGGAIPTRTAL